MGRVFASYTGGLWIKFWVGPYFLCRNKTSEYSECREQLTLEHFLLYNYRSSTLPGISRNMIDFYDSVMLVCGLLDPLESVPPNPLFMEMGTSVNF